MEQEYFTGADESPYDIRTFAYIPSGVPNKGGSRYTTKDITDQHKVGICTANSIVMNAQKVLGEKFSAEFQYLCQKKFFDLNWNEGSSALHGMKVLKNIGLLPAKYWTFSTEADRKLPYEKYIKKLQAVSDKEIEKLKKKASLYKIEAYAKVSTDRDLLAQAILESNAGVITRYNIGSEWWTAPIEPLRPPKSTVSGHLVIDTNYDGNSFRIANGWGADWADKGTAYRLHKQYQPTEAWIVYYEETPKAIQEQVETRKGIKGQMLNVLQFIINLIVN